jgi:hypothetical protein
MSCPPWTMAGNSGTEVITENGILSVTCHCSVRTRPGTSCNCGVTVNSTIAVVHTTVLFCLLSHCTVVMTIDASLICNFYIMVAIITSPACYFENVSSVNVTIAICLYYSQIISHLYIHVYYMYRHHFCKFLIIWLLNNAYIISNIVFNINSLNFLVCFSLIYQVFYLFQICWHCLISILCIVLFVGLLFKHLGNVYIHLRFT